MGPGGFALCAMLGWAGRCSRGRRPAVRAACCCLWPHGCSGRRRARPPARLGPHFVRRRASKPARALRSLRRPPHQWCQVADVWRVGSKPGQAPPPPTGAAARPPPRSPLVPSGPSALLHSGVATKEPRFCLLIRGIALLREALHWLVASAMPRYLVHCFLTQRIPTHAHGVCG